jgi:hypothetical protein
VGGGRANVGQQMPCTDGARLAGERPGTGETGEGGGGGGQHPAIAARNNPTIQALSMFTHVHPLSPPSPPCIIHLGAAKLAHPHMAAKLTCKRDGSSGCLLCVQPAEVSVAVERGRRRMYKESTGQHGVAQPARAWWKREEQGGLRYRHTSNEETAHLLVSYGFDHACRHNTPLAPLSHHPPGCRTHPWSQ